MRKSLVSIAAVLLLAGARVAQGGNSPTGVRAVRAKTGVRLSWTRVAGATSYEVRRGGKLVATTGASSWLDRKPGKRPRYTLRAVNAAGASRDSAPVTP